jgi:putative tryptophan/tyrosine transport system substrate-binding protein
MNNIKKPIFIFIVLVCMINVFSLEARAEKKIGILLFSEEVRYNETKMGIMDQLKRDGFGEPAVKFTIVNAKGSKAKAMEMVHQFAAAKMNLIFAIGTSAAVIASTVITDIPIVFSEIYNPVESGIANDWENSGNNTTGASTRIPMSKVVNLLKELAPVKKLVVLYTPGEKNTEAQLLELQKTQKDCQIAIVPVILTAKEEVIPILSQVLSKTDAIYLTGSSIVGATVPVIVDMANKANLITVTHLDDLVEKGALLGVAVNSYMLGRLAGQKAVMVLKGAKPSSIPIEVGKELNLIINLRTAKAGCFYLPPSFMKKVTKIVK